MKTLLVLNLKIMHSVKPFTLVMVDTGADISVIKWNVLIPTGVTVDPLKIISLQGITVNKVYTLGSVMLPVFVTEQFSVIHEFYLVDSNFPIVCDAVMGTDFLSKSDAIIDFERNGIFLYKQYWLDFAIIKVYENYNQISAIDNMTQRNNIDRWIHPSFLNFLDFNLMSMLDEINGFVQQHEDIYESYLKEFGYPVPKLQNPITELLTNNESVIPEATVLVISDTNMILSRREKVLSLVKIETESEKELAEMKDIISSFSDIFHLEGELLQPTDILYVSIPLKPDTNPVNIRQYRLSPPQQMEIKKQVNELLANNIIRHSRSEWSAPVLLVPKKSDIPGEKLQRLVFDYRVLNTKILRDSYPLPNISDILDRINGTKFFSKIDLVAGFHQLPIKETDKCKTAFSTPDGLFEFSRLPFGICVAPSAFSRAMNFVLRKHLDDKICYCYIDDVIILGNTESEHKANVFTVLSTLRENKLSLKPSKCVFFARKVIYLGFQISEEGILPDPQKVEALRKLEVKKTLKGVRSFLGAIGYYRKHAPNFASMAKPLYTLLKTSNKFNWTPECDLAALNLKNSLIQDCLLKKPDFDKVFILSTDSSKHTIAGALSQPNELSDDDAIGFFSRVLKGPEINYSVIEKEFLSILDSLLYFRCYLIGVKIPTKIITDHRPLKYLMNLKQSSSRLIRWALKLEEFNIQIIYRPGEANFVADALSRVEQIEKSISNANLNALTRAQALKQKELADSLNDPQSSGNRNTANSTTNNSILQDIPDIGQSSVILDTESISDSLRVGSPTYSPSHHVIDIVPDETEIFSDQESQSFEPRQNNCEPIINLTDEQEILEILKLHHDSSLGAHFGVNKTLAKIRQYYTWAGMDKDVKDYIKKCHICQKFKAQGTTRAPMVIVSTAKNSFDRISIDIVGPLTVTDRYNKFILTVQDDLTKFVFVLPLPNQETDTVARALVEKVFLVFGSPNGILSDQGTNFMSKLFASICKFFRSHHVHSSVYHPESNGSIEKYHYVLKNYLRAFTNKHQTDWDLWCKFAAFCYNTTPHTSTKVSPFELVFGRKANIPSVITKKPEILYNYDNYLLELKYKLQHANKIAVENLRLSKTRSKEYYDRSAKETSYNVGDSVLIKANHSKIGHALFEKWTGPFKVTSVVSPQGIIIKDGNKQKFYHNNLVKPYHS